MTEYDYSPEAYQRAAATDKRIRNWRDMCDHQAPQFTTPFAHTPSEHHSRSRSRAVSPASSESSLVDSTYHPSHHRSKREKKSSRSKSKHHREDHKSRSRSMSYSVPPGQQYDYHHPGAAYPGAQPIYASHDSSAHRSSSRHHSSKKDKDHRHRDRDRDSHRDSKPSRHQSPVTTPGLPGQQPQYTTIPLGNNMYYSMPSYTTSPPVASPTYTAAPGQQSYFNMYPPQQQQQQQYYHPSVVPPQPHAARSNSMPVHYIPGQPGHYPTPGGSVTIVPGSTPMSPPYGAQTPGTKAQPWFKRMLGMSGGSNGGGSGNGNGGGSSSGHARKQSDRPNKISRSRRRSY